MNNTKSLIVFEIGTQLVYFFATFFLNFVHTKMFALAINVVLLRFDCEVKMVAR